MQAMTEFNFHTHAVRVFPTDDGSGFVAVASDVARALEYSSAKDMLRCVDDEDKGWAELPTLGGRQRMLTINESGLSLGTLRKTIYDLREAGRLPRQEQGEFEFSLDPA